MIGRKTLALQTTTYNNQKQPPTLTVEPLLFCLQKASNDTSCRVPFLCNILYKRHATSHRKAALRPGLQCIVTERTATTSGNTVACCTTCSSFALPVAVSKGQVVLVQLQHHCDVRSQSDFSTYRTVTWLEKELPLLIWGRKRVLVVWQYWRIFSFIIVRHVRLSKINIFRYSGASQSSGCTYKCCCSSWCRTAHNN